MEKSLLANEDPTDPDPTYRTRSKASFSEIHVDDAPIKGELELGDATSLSSFINLTNTIIGSGVLGLPYALSKCGYVLGTALIILSAGATIFSLHLLTLCSHKVDYPKSFYHVTEASVPQLTFLIDFSVAILCFGVGASYLVVIGDLMPDMMSQFGASGAFTKRFTWIIIGFCVVAPISCLQKLDALKFTSAMSVAFVLFVTFMVFLYSLDAPGLDKCAGFNDEDGESCTGDKVAATVTFDTFRVFGIFVFAFTCQTNVFAMVNELRSPTQNRFDRITSVSIFAASALYLIVGISGYATYGSEVDPDILVNYPKNTLTSIARLAVSLLVAFSYPLQCHPARLSLMALWRQFDSEEDAGDQFYLFRFYLITALFLGLSLVIGIVVTDLGLILGLIGSTGATIICYILPGISYYKLFKDEGPAWKRIGALILTGAGCLIMPVCLAFMFV